MNARQANKIMKQDSPRETDSRSRTYWNRYYTADYYIGRLYRRLFRKLRKNGREFLSNEQIDECINAVYNEEKIK